MLGLVINFTQNVVKKQCKKIQSNSLVGIFFLIIYSIGRITTKPKSPLKQSKD